MTVSATTRYATAARHLRERDPVMARLIDHVGECRLKRAPSHFLSLVEAVVWQQLSFKAAITIHSRMLDALGTQRPVPEDFLRTSTRVLRGTGLSGRKVEYLKGIADYFHSGAFPRRRLRTMNDDEIVAELTRVRGIGPWSAEMFLIFALNRLDVFPIDDLGLRNAIRNVYGLRMTPSDRRLDNLSEPWRPYRTIASWYLWAGADGLPFK